MATDMPGLPENHKEIDGHTYHVHMLPALKARKLLLKIAKLLGPSFGHLGAQGEDANLGTILAGALSAIDDDAIDHIHKVLGEVTLVDIQKTGGGHLTPVFYDEHFRGRLGAAFKWLAFALEVQFSDFLGELREVFQNQMTPLAPVNQSPSI